MMGSGLPLAPSSLNANFHLLIVVGLRSTDCVDFPLLNLSSLSRTSNFTMRHVAAVDGAEAHTLRVAAEVDPEERLRHLQQLIDLRLTAIVLRREMTDPNRFSLDVSRLVERDGHFFTTLLHPRLLSSPTSSTLSYSVISVPHHECLRLPTETA